LGMYGRGKAATPFIKGPAGNRKENSMGGNRKGAGNRLRESGKTKKKSQKRSGRKGKNREKGTKKP